MTDSARPAEDDLEVNLDDPEVRTEVRVILKALARLLAHSRHTAQRSRNFEDGRAVFEKKKLPPMRSSGVRRRSRTY